MDLKLALDDVRQDIARLREVEAALVKALGVPTGQPDRNSGRVSPAGGRVISLRASIRHAQKYAEDHPLDKAAAAKLQGLQTAYAAARRALDDDRRAKGQRIR